MEKNARETELTTFVSGERNLQVRDPTSGLASLSLKLIDLDISGVPDVDNTILGNRDKVIRLALVWIFTIDLNCAWNELDISDAGLVRLVDVTEDELLHLLGLLLALVVFVSLGLGCVVLILLAALLDDVLC